MTTIGMTATPMDWKTVELLLRSECAEHGCDIGCQFNLMDLRWEFAHWQRNDVADPTETLTMREVNLDRVRAWQRSYH